MAYATLNDILNRFNPIKTMIGSADEDVTSVSVTSLYIGDAEGVVNSYLGARYTVPLVTEPIITHITADLAIFKICEDRLPRIPDYAEARYRGAITLLEQLRDGKMVLSSSQSLPSGGGDDEAWSSTQSYHPVFSPVLDDIEQRVDAEAVTADKDERITDG